MLSDDELSEAWSRYLTDKSIDDLDLLVRQYLPLAKFFARRALAKAPAHQDSEEILSYATDGLIKAIQRFDPTVGVKFETYATRRIPGAIIDGQRAQDPLARSMRRRVKLVRAATETLWERLQRDPNIDEICDEVQLSRDEVREALIAQQTINDSLDKHDEETHRVEEGDASLVAQMSEVRAQVAAHLASLSERERAFVLHYYCDARSMKETAERLSISGDWCRQTKQHVLATFRR